MPIQTTTRQNQLFQISLAGRLAILDGRIAIRRLSGRAHCLGPSLTCASYLEEALADYFQPPNQLMTFHQPLIRHTQSPYQYLIADRLETIWVTTERNAFHSDVRMWFRLQDQ